MPEGFWQPEGLPLPTYESFCWAETMQHELLSGIDDICTLARQVLDVTEADVFQLDESAVELLGRPARWGGGDRVGPILLHLEFFVQVGFCHHL